MENERNNDFTIEWSDKNGRIDNVRVTRGKAAYRLPWWRRMMMRIIGRSHWHHVEINRGSDMKISRIPEQTPDTGASD